MRYSFFSAIAITVIAFLILGSNNDASTRNLNNANLLYLGNTSLSDKNVSNGENVFLNQTWHFDRDCAAIYYNAVGGNAMQQTNAKKNQAQQDRCTFWTGGPLNSGTQGPVTVTPIRPDPIERRTCWILISSTPDGDTIFAQGCQ